MNKKSVAKKINSGIKLFQNKVNQKKFEWFLSPKKFDEIQRTALPRKAAFNVSNICTSNCVFCAFQYNRDPVMIMGNDLFDLCCGQFSDLQPNSWITLTPLVGEPFTDREIFNKITMAKKRGIKRIETYSNGTLLDKNVEEILNSPLDELYISFPDFIEEEYKIIFRTNNYAISLKGIHNLLNKHSERKSNLLIQINIRGRKKPAEVFCEADFLRYIKPFLSPRVTLNFTPAYDNWAGMIKQEDLPAGMRLQNDTKRKAGLPCARLFEIIFLQNGDVKLCGCRFKRTIFDDLIIGNIYKNNLKDIWFGEKAYAIRNEFLRGRYLDICKDCSLYKKIKYSLF